ncbi:MAG: PIG-L family deacetylase [Candidatus Nanopelagicales bacterium]
MIPLSLAKRNLRVLAVGAHSDDLEIGAGGTLLRLDQHVSGLQVRCVVLTADGERAAEARASAAAFLPSAHLDFSAHALRDGYLPVQWDRVKEILTKAAEFSPDVILCPGVADAHQDHRTVAQIVPTVFRDHLVLQYEIIKWDGDLGAGRPTHYVPLTEEIMARKCHLLAEHFATQRDKDWFGEDTFRALGRLRGVECRAAFAEAFTVPKALIDFGQPDGRERP